MEGNTGLAGGRLGANSDPCVTFLVAITTSFEGSYNLQFDLRVHFDIHESESLTRLLSELEHAIVHGHYLG